MRQWVYLGIIAALLAGCIYFGVRGCNKGDNSSVVAWAGDVMQTWLLNKTIWHKLAEPPETVTEYIVRKGSDDGSQPIVAWKTTDTLWRWDGFWATDTVWKRRDGWTFKLHKGDSLGIVTASSWRNTVTWWSDSSGVYKTERWLPVDVGVFAALRAGIALPAADDVRWQAEAGLLMQYRMIRWRLGVGSGLDLKPYALAQVEWQAWF